MVVIYTSIFFLPLNNQAFQTALQATLDLAKWYAQEHVILCLLPAFFIAGIIAVFISKDSVLRYLGAHAPRWLSYSVAAISGGILAVCSCTILPLFTSIYKRGAGLGPAMAFLYSGPAISMLSIILTARILGMEMGIARTVCAVGFSIIIGMVMAWIYRREEQQKAGAQSENKTEEKAADSFGQTAVLFFSMVAVLIFANWAAPGEPSSAIWAYAYSYRWYIVGAAALLMCWSMVEHLRIPAWKVYTGAIVVVLSIAAASLFIPVPMFTPLPPMVVALVALSMILLSDKSEANREWALASWDFAKKTIPLMGIGIIITGMLLGSSHGDTSIPGLIPAEWVQQAVGGNGMLANFLSSIIGAFMYFSTLTEIPIVQGLLSSGMGKGPALALLLAGPSLSLPNMLVVSGVMGWKKTAIYVSLVIVLSSISGYVYGNFIS